MDQDDNIPIENSSKGYELNGKIMLTAVIILFAVVVFVLVLHLYVRWYILRIRRRQLLLRRDRVNRRTQIVFYVDNHPTGSESVVNRGLEPAVLNSLPVFEYSSKKTNHVSECSVCLSEFEDGDMGRVLPKCGHCFHIECIDMWFHTCSTCPLCRSTVEPVQQTEMTAELSEPVEVQDATSSSSEGRGASSRRKGLDMRIEVPRRTELEDELPLSSSASQGFKSPGSRLLSIKRILSMGRKSPVGAATSAGAGTSCSDSVGSELDLESGLTQDQTRSWGHS